jgi:peptide/nickel transport system substrate-binding protein
MKHLITRCCSVVVLAMLIAVPLAEAKKDTLVVAFDRRMMTLDNNETTDRSSLVLYHNWGDTLVYRDPVKREMVPCLAESYKFLDPTTIEMKLRKGVSFHNGEPFNAEAVRYSMEILKDPKTLNYGYFKVFKEVQVVDEYTVRLVSDAPNPTALEMIANMFSIYPPQYYKKVGREGFGKSPIGTGPYQFVSWKQDTEVVFKANPNYFGDPKGKARIPNLLVRIIPEEVTRVAELMTGGVDLIRGGLVSPEQIPLIEKNPGLKIDSDEILRTWYITMDSLGRSGINFFKDKRVRQAVNHAIDKNEIIETVLKGYAKVTNSAANTLHFGYEPNVTTYPFDPAKAKKLLADAGFPNGFTVDYYAYRDKSVAEAISGYLTAVGIKTNMKWLGGQWDVMDKNLAAGTVPLAYISWGSYSVFDASSILDRFFKSDNPQCYGTTPEVDKLLTEANNIVDPGKRKELYSKAQKIIADEAYWVPLYNAKVISAMSKNLNFKPSYDEIDRYFTAAYAD